MKFKVGDFAIHPIYGVGEVVEIEERQFSEEETQLYYKVALYRNTIWIPVEAQRTIGLRSVTDKSELDQYRDVLKSPPAPIPKKYNQRHQEQGRHLKEGSFRVVCEVVRDLTAWNLQKPLGSADKATLEKTREKLYGEWAMAANIPIPEATEEVNGLLPST